MTLRKHMPKLTDSVNKEKEGREREKGVMVYLK